MANQNPQQQQPNPQRAQPGRPDDQPGRRDDKERDSKWDGQKEETNNKPNPRN